MVHCDVLRSYAYVCMMYCAADRGSGHIDTAWALGFSILRLTLLLLKMLVCWRLSVSAFHATGQDVPHVAR